jgi:hypothetical protein
LGFGLIVINRAATGLPALTLRGLIGYRWTTTHRPGSSSNYRSGAIEIAARRHVLIDGTPANIGPKSKYGRLRDR